MAFSNHILWTTIIVLFLLLVSIVMTGSEGSGSVKKVPETKSGQSGQSGQCTAETCGAIDPVNEPDYNMKQVIKNTLLIEDHLADKKKYCKSCLVKHFLLNDGYLDEAVWMAGNKVKQYPMLVDSVSLNKTLFKKWHSNMDNEDVCLEILTTLREWRRDLVEKYYF